MLMKNTHSTHVEAPSSNAQAGHVYRYSGFMAGDGRQRRHINRTGAGIGTSATHSILPAELCLCEVQDKRTLGVRWRLDDFNRSLPSGGP